MKTKKYLSVVIILTMLMVLVSATSVFAAAEKMPVCHVDEMGILHFINISENAYDTHLAHGDKKIGDVVPGMAGMTYGSDCTPVKTFADVSGVWTGETGLAGSLGFAFTMTLTQDGTNVEGIVYSGAWNGTRTVTGTIVGNVMSLHTSGGGYWADFSGNVVSDNSYYGIGIDSSSLNVAMQAHKEEQIKLKKMLDIYPASFFYV